jgi:hypothetical protein
MAGYDPPRSTTASVLVAGILALGVVISSLLVAHAGVLAFRIKHGEKRVVVTGSATRRIQSDFVVWRATVKSQAAEMASAYKKLSADVPALSAFIQSRGVDPKQIKISAASIQELHPRDHEGREILETTVAYVTEQEIEVSSADIEKVEKVSREATDLIDRGIFIHSDAPLYIYTKLAELKVQMLAEASKDARTRAEQIATQAKSEVTSLLTARMGVLQINPAYSTEVSAEGNNDKTSLEKDVLAVVTASFGVD